MRSFASIVSIFLTVMVLRADCPTPIECGPGVCVWPSNVGVSYAFPSSNPPPCWAAQSIAGLGIDGDINSAFNRWGCEELRAAALRLT